MKKTALTQFSRGGAIFDDARGGFHSQFIKVGADALQVGNLAFSVALDRFPEARARALGHIVDAFCLGQGGDCKGNDDGELHIG